MEGFDKDVLDSIDKTGEVDVFYNSNDSDGPDDDDASDHIDDRRLFLRGPNGIPEHTATVMVLSLLISTIGLCICFGLGANVSITHDKWEAYKVCVAKANPQDCRVR